MSGQCYLGFLARSGLFDISPRTGCSRASASSGMLSPISPENSECGGRRQNAGFEVRSETSQRVNALLFSTTRCKRAPLYSIL